MEDIRYEIAETEAKEVHRLVDELMLEIQRLDELMERMTNTLIEGGYYGGIPGLPEHRSSGVGDVRIVP